MDPTIAARDVITWFEDRIGELTNGDYVVLVLAAAAFAWVVASLRAATRIGPIEVELFEHDEGDTPEVRALTTSLRERLARSGLSPPPEVPAGTPQTDLISAVESSNIPQSAWLTKLLQMLPKPPQPPRYRLSATLLRTSRPTIALGGAAGADQTVAWQYGIRFWLRPTREGTPLLDTVWEQPDYRSAVERAAAKIFVHISNDAVHVFPPWARWRTAEGFLKYLDGVYELRRRRETNADVAEAERCFRAAAAAEPANVLARLQIANLLEYKATRTSASAAAPSNVLKPEEKLVAQGHALRRYLDLAIERPELVEPRYRASILASMLASTVGERSYEALPKSDRDSFVASLKLDRGASTADVDRAALSKRLQNLAERESDAVLALLQPWYVALFRQRPRYRFEIRGFERRQLRSTVNISRHCLRVRRLQSDESVLARLEIAGRRAAMRVVRLWLSRVTLGWQGFYNAGCFYALLAGSVHASRAGASPQRVDAARARLKRRAFRCLNRAVEEGGEEISTAWLERSDPDLVRLRNHEDWRWRLLLQRHRGLEDTDLRGYPSRPWRAPKARTVGWTVIVIGGVASAFSAGAVLDGDVWSDWKTRAAFVLAAMVAAYHAVRAWRETEYQGEYEREVRARPRRSAEATSA